MSIKPAAGEFAFECGCLVYIRCYQEAGSKVGIYSSVDPSAVSSPKSGTSLGQKPHKVHTRLTSLISTKRSRAVRG